MDIEPYKLDTNGNRLLKIKGATDEQLNNIKKLFTLRKCKDGYTTQVNASFTETKSKIEKLADNGQR